MAKTIRHFSFYYKGRKAATCNSTDYNIENGGEGQIGDEGWMGRSQGAILTRLSTDHVVPVEGVGLSVVRDMLNQNYVDVGLGIVDGKIHKVEMAIASANFRGEAANGTQMGRFEFEGGKPEAVG